MKWRARSIAFWSLLVIFIFGALVWLLRAPSRPFLAYRAVPVFADFVSVHDYPAGRADDLLNNPLLIIWLQQYGVLAKDLASWRDDSAVRRWIRRLADRQLVIASYPADAGRRVWFFSSRLETRATRLRWMLKLGALPAFKPIGQHQGRTIWMLDSRMTTGPNRLTIAFEEGLLIGCWSEHPSDIRMALDTYDGAIPSLITTKIPTILEANREIADRFWWRTPLLGGRTDLQGNITRADAGGVTIRMITPIEHHRLYSPPDRAMGQINPLAFFGVEPAAVLQSNPSWIAELVKGRLPAPTDELITSALTETDTPWIVALFDGEYSGRLWRLRIPTFVFAAPVKDSNFAPARIQAHLDRLNAVNQTSLLLGPVPGASNIFSLGMADGSIYAALPMEEQAAIAFHNGWMYVSSNLDALRKLIGYDSTAHSPNTRSDPLPTGTVSHVHIDLARAGAAMRSSLSVAALALMMQNRDGTRETRAWINRIREWITVWMTSGRLEGILRLSASGAFQWEIEWQTTAADDKRVIENAR